MKGNDLRNDMIVWYDTKFEFKASIDFKSNFVRIIREIVLDKRINVGMVSEGSRKFTAKCETSYLVCR